MKDGLKRLCVRNGVLWDFMNECPKWRISSGGCVIDTFLRNYIMMVLLVTSMTTAMVMIMFMVVMMMIKKAEEEKKKILKMKKKSHKSKKCHYSGLFFLWYIPYKFLHVTRTWTDKSLF
jgi:hypothetical protein